MISEGKALGKLAHQNVVQIFDFFEADNTVALVLEFVEGGSIADRIEADGALPEGEVVELMTGVLHGLDALHDQGMIHRDIKPDNVLLSKRKGRWSQRLPTWGSHNRAKALGSLVMGLAWGRPNIWRRSKSHLVRRASRATSMLGVMMFEMLTGTVPFSGTDFEIQSGHVHTQLDRSRLPSSTKDWLAAVLLKAVAKNPSDRFESAQAFLDCLSNRKAPAQPAPEPKAAVTNQPTPQPQAPKAPVKPVDDFKPPAPDQARAPTSSNRSMVYLGIAAVVVIVGFVALNFGGKSAPEERLAVSTRKANPKPRPAAEKHRRQPQHLLLSLWDVLALVALAGWWHVCHW